MPKIEIGISVKILPAQEYHGNYTDKIGVVKQSIFCFFSCSFQYSFFTL